MQIIPRVRHFAHKYVYGFKTKCTIGNNGRLNGNDTISDLLSKAILFNFSGKVWVRKLFYVCSNQNKVFHSLSTVERTFYIYVHQKTIHNAQKQHFILIFRST